MNILVNEAAKLSLLLDIASRAIDAEERRQTRRFMQEDLNCAYTTWKDEQGIEYVERDSEAWKLMMAATSSEYDNLDEAKSAERNADKRLRNVVYKYKAIIDAEKMALAGLEPVKNDNRGANAEFWAQAHP